MSTAIQALVRAPFCPSVVEESWDAKLLEEARELLGYRPTAVVTAQVARTRNINENIFARALEKLDIQPFTLDSVEAYKAKMLKEAHRGESCRLVRYMHASGGHTMRKGQAVIYGVGWPAWLGFVAAGLVCAILHYSGYSAGWGWDSATQKSIELFDHMSWATMRYVMALPSLAVATWGGLLWARHKAAIAVNASWRRIPVLATIDVRNEPLGYVEAIPPFAIQRMISLKKELPETTFYVDQLDSYINELNTEKAVKLPSDPFLIATFRGVSAYIDVWDEPKFEGRRQV